MRRCSWMFVILILFFGCSSPTQDSNAKTIYWGCLNEGTSFDPQKSYQLGAFLHSGDKFSIRRQNWEDVEKDTGYWENSVGVIMVPYLKDVETGMICSLIRI